MKATIYVEGGRIKNRAVRVECRTAFRKYCEKLTASGRFEIVVCGARDQAYKEFRLGLRTVQKGEAPVLLVDSEGAVPEELTEEQFLASGPDQWNFPATPVGRVFLMVQAMEAWFFADRRALDHYYGQGFQVGALCGSDRRTEEIPKDDLLPSLKAATRATRTKGVYQKTKHGFAILELIDPMKVELSSPRAKAFHEFLRSL